ncbi:hypothetical protein SDRG_02257 [Saprolegnia diclina VS20]|uniref:Uncharacterized protein n=1 Tax=Saprolegnia diclina (strain VS20) TaxID=1156394 RepID=T0R075_SAPDV|nr:hypothetical protein SDRG_02257 [Saprolegnia diclina VS20]EQC40356.1 hypothetical protein SDRG_02257 [Saprolegnia diclina VS20]|eukprot:XP_008606055.1 hypothetical protein SDRG_02257 [Saprolegnia diclina VS20]
MDDDTDELERHWAARVLQQTWRDYTDRQWAKWRALHTTDDDGDNSRACNSTSSARLNSDNDDDESLVDDAPSSGNNPLESARSASADLSAAHEALLAQLEADPAYQSLAATEVALDDQVHFLQQQQAAVAMQQRQFRLRQLAKEKEEKQRRKLARQRAKELAQRRAEEEEKFHTLETMAIIRDVDFSKRAPTKKAKPKPRPAPAMPPPLAVAEIAPVMKIYPRLPNLAATTKGTARSAAAEVDEPPPKIDHTKKTIACYAQDLTPLLNGEKPKRVKVALPKKEKHRKPRVSSKATKPAPSNQVDEPPFSAVQADVVPPAIRVPKKNEYGKSAMTSAPLTAEIKHLSWMTTLQKEFDQVVLQSPSEPPPPLSSFAQSLASTPASSTLSPRIPLALGMKGQHNASLLTTTTNAPSASTDADAHAALAARREFLLGKYGKSQTPDQPLVADTTDRLQSILNKYKAVTSSVADDRTSITPSSTQSLLAKYAGASLVGGNRA